MGNSFPFGFPYSSYYRRKFSPYSSKNMVANHSSCNNSFKQPGSEKFLQCQEKTANKERPLWQFCGIELYSDDILIISLLFFLYTEGVKDEWLFICLILLLLG